MRRRLSSAFALGAFLTLALNLLAQAPLPAPPETQPREAARQRIESFLRFLYAWGPETEVHVGPLLESRLPGVYSVLVEVRRDGRQMQDVLLSSADGRYLLRGDFFDTTQNPFAAALAGMQLAGYPSLGPADAPVVIVEYGDFQCPDCQQLAPVLKKVLARHPTVRLVWKDFPLTQIHKWALSAHIAARCVYEQSNTEFWRAHDYLFDNQKQLTADNLPVRLESFLAGTSIDLKAYRACRDQESSRVVVEQSLAEGRTLGVAETPTLFVNGRHMVGAGSELSALLDRIIEFELGLRQQGSGTQ